MRLNQVTITMPDIDAGWRFYTSLGLMPVVDARPRYVRLVCPSGDTTLSLHHGETGSAATTIYFECDDLDQQVSDLRGSGLVFASGPEDKSWLWREAELLDPGGNRVVLYFAGANRLNPPWRVSSTAPG